MKRSTTPKQPSISITGDPRWALIMARDPAADDAFFFSVESTGVYCRPSCAARRPRPENVRFHASAADAERAGFRPCRRCIPNRPPLAQRHAALVAEACRRIEAAEEEPGLAALAAAAAMSSSHFHRVFRAATGLTPKAYVAAHRKQAVQQALRSSPTVTEALYEAGYNSGGRFYAASRQVLGMSPSAFRKGGSGESIRFALGKCSLGSILVAQSGAGICAISLGDDPEQLLRELKDRFPQAELVGQDPVFEQQVAMVVALVEAPATGISLPLDIRGTAFQQRVWQALRLLPPGTTASYTAIAKAVGMPGAVRAVARACAANRLAVAIPCHRVVRRDGDLCGYRWGVERKRKLLAREAAP